MWRSRSNLYFVTDFFLGSHHEWNQQTRNRNVRRDSCCKLVRGVQGNLLRRLDHHRHRLLTLSPVSIPYDERKWIDIEPGFFHQCCFGVSKLTIRLLRHDDSIHREEDGAVRSEELASIFRSKIEFTSHLSIQTWISFLRKGGGQKKGFQYCLNPASSEHFLYFRAIQ